MEYKTSKFNYMVKCDDGSLRMYNSMVGAKSLLMVRPAISDSVLNAMHKDELCNDLPEYVRTPLIEHGYLVPVERDEELAVAVKASETVFNEKYLSLIVMPTEQCNFRCKYCYETFAKGKMTPEMQDSLIKYVQKNISNYTGLSVIWFGGEPLEALDVVENLSKKFIEICKRAKKMYVSGMTTNGYNLTPDVFERLYKLNVFTYQVTLDGFKSQHDNQRMLVNGKGTFETIVDNLIYIKNARKFGTVVMVRTNFTKAIIENIDEYFAFYKSSFGDDRHFTLYIQKASDWGGNSVKNFSGELVEDVHSYVLKKMKEYGLYLGISSHYSELECDLNTCYAAKKGHFVIGSDGTIYRCTTRFDFPENNVGTLKPNGRMELNENYNKWFYIYTHDDNASCSACFNRASCLPMKCPYHRFKSNVPYCPPMGGNKLGMFLERFRDDLFYILDKKS